MTLIEGINSHRSNNVELYVDNKKVFSGIGIDIYRKFSVKNDLFWNEIKNLECICVIDGDVVRLYVKTVKRVLLSHNLYGGKSIFCKGTNPYELETRTCNHSDTCSLYQNGLCISLKRLSNGFCKHCVKGVEKGGYNSKKGREIHTKYYELKENNPNLLDFDGHFFAVGNEYAFKLVYPSIGILPNVPNDEYKAIDRNRDYDLYNEVRWVSHSIYDWAFIPKEFVTDDFMYQLLNFKPRTLLEDGIIKAYQDKIVPRIKIDILKYAPELAKKIGLENVNYVGKLGLIKTLKPNITIQTNVPDIRANGNEKYSVYWDGETVTVLNPKSLFQINNLIGTFKEGVVKFIPNDDLLGVIEDNSWVLPETIIKES